MEIKLSLDTIEKLIRLGEDMEATETDANIVAQFSVILATAATSCTNYTEGLAEEAFRVAQRMALSVSDKNPRTLDIVRSMAEDCGY